MTDKELLDELTAINFTPERYYNGIGESEDDFDATTQEHLDLLRKDYTDKGMRTEAGKAAYKLWIDTRAKAAHAHLGKYALHQEVERVGGEDEGSHYHIVLYFPEVDKYVRAEGWYSSYEGVSDWNPWYVVTKQERKVVVYE